MTTYNKLPYSNQFERGHSFNWAGKGTAGKYYYNNSYITDFVVYKNVILVCRKDHLATNELEPELVVTNGQTTDVKSSYGEFIVAASGDSSYMIHSITYDNTTRSITIEYGDDRSETFSLDVTDTSTHIGPDLPLSTDQLGLDTSDSDNIRLKLYIDNTGEVICSSSVCNNAVLQSDLSNMFVTLSESDYTSLVSPNPDTYYFTYEDE